MYMKLDELFALNWSKNLEITLKMSVGVPFPLKSVIFESVSISVELNRNCVVFLLCLANKCA